MCYKKNKLYKKRENEKRVMFYMINLYCKHHHKDYQKICLKPNSTLTDVFIESALLNKPIEKNLLSSTD